MSGLYTSVSGLMSNIQKLEVHGNNIANAATNAYKTDQESFKVFDETFKRANTATDNRRLGAYSDQVYVDDVRTYFEAGTAKATENQLDFMLTDPAGGNKVSFFVVNKGDQEYLTRNGGFTLDANRSLSTLNGGLVLDENNKTITIPEHTRFSVNAEGVIHNDETNDVIATLRLHSVAENDLQLLQKKQGGFYEVMTLNKIERTFGPIGDVLAQFQNNPTIRGVFGSIERIQSIMQTGEVDILTLFEGQLQSNMIESSNVDLSKEMIGLMTAQKGIASSQKVSNVMDSIFEKEANEIGK